MNVHLGFAPDAERARRLDRRMHAELAGSLRHLRDVARGSLECDDAALGRLIDEIEAGRRAAPAVFGDYYDLAAALLEEDTGRAQKAIARLCRPSMIGDSRSVGALRSPDSCPTSARYVRLMQDESDSDIAIRPPTAAAVREFIERYDGAVQLLRRAAPELLGEIEAIVHDLVLVAGDPSRSMQFDGGSHFQLWGALFLNVDFHRTVHEVVEVLAHESAHSLLFGFCIGEFLVENDDAEVYASPLRVDARPMDGIYHATFVSARMHWAMSRLLASGLLDEMGAAAAAAARDADLANFESGYAVVREHGRLTATGAALMQGARDYIDSAGR